MAIDTQMYEHTFDGVKGWFGEWVVDFQARLSADVSIVAYVGRCVHLNDDGDFEMGAVGYQMPMFLTVGSNYPSAGNSSPSGRWYAVHGARLSAVVAVSGLEVETTEFDSDQTYLPNQPLRAIASNSDQTTGGRLTNAGVVKAESATPASATAIVGIVSRAARKVQGDRNTVLAFWPVFKPGAGSL